MPPQLQIKLPKDKEKLLLALFHKGKFSTIIQQVQDLRLHFPKDVFLLNILGASYAHCNDFTSAIETYSQAISISPKDAELHFNLGRAKKMTGDIDGALTSYQQALRLNPRNATIYNNIGNLWLSKGNLPKAVDNLQMSIKYKSDFAFAHFNLGCAFQAQQRFDDAIDSYNKAILHKPDYFEAQHNLIDILTYHIPNADGSNSLIKANNAIRSIKMNDISQSLFLNRDIKAYYKQMYDIVSLYDVEKPWPYSQIYQRNDVDLNCKRHKSIFEKHNVIPKFCFGCYKVEILPINVADLFKTVFLFSKLKLQNNNARKCFVELRPKISGTYKGLIYCSSLDEAISAKQALADFTAPHFQKAPQISIKRGCSEFGELYPDYKHINYTGAQKMIYPEAWAAAEDIYDRQQTFSEKPQITLSILSLSNALTMLNWLSYAKIIGDSSYHDISNNVSVSKYIETNLKNQITKRVLS
ncbi:tetratricopeptide repeat protein [Candidatus Puniceispirillum marinum]|uniref:Tetratricopeptide repeat family protein n=1 Tax=Puniceispirillum marinum (strain IMCC1322) TaxID=488538 RepID=D5BTF3_PUNMI|nr:tetratricopeptide repeat protein [Candidatus Puniceispirillum marinum]ADE39550.1 tetratricopeptide repeat family protein [Candidatus Puniceispirillum marinum IMCC1322]